MIKAVLDTNVLIDSLSDLNSFGWKILEFSKSSDVQFYASHKIIKEYKLIISREVKKEEDKKDLQDFISRIIVVEPKKRVNIVKYDKEDNKFVDVAIEAGADYIISSDSHLLELVDYNGIEMISPKDFYYKFKSGDEWGDVFSNLFK